MNSDTYRRIPLLVAGLLAFLALSSSSALAAGLPVVNSFESPFGYGTLNTKLVGGGVTPNGASTTYKIEYGPTKALGESTKETEIGSGTSEVSANTKLKGLLINTQYYARLVAKNSYGTASSSTITVLRGQKGHWVTALMKTIPASYASSGSFAINFGSISGTNAEIACSSTGSGTLGNKTGIGDKYSVQPSGCGVYFEGKKSCPATIGTFNLSERLILPGGAFTVVTSASCPFPFTNQITLPILEPFTATKLNSLPEVELPIELQSTASFGVHTATITDSSTWHLTGENSGVSFNMEYAE